MMPEQLLPKAEDTTTTNARRKRRWGDVGPVEENVNTTTSSPSLAAAASAAAAVINVDSVKSVHENGNALPVNSIHGTNPPSAMSNSDAMARAAALQASIRERLAALKARTAKNTTTAPLAVISTTATTVSSGKRTKGNDDDDNDNDDDDDNETSPHKQKENKKAKIFELDMSSTAPTRILERKQRREERLRAAQEKQMNEEGIHHQQQPKESINPYLAYSMNNNFAASSSLTTNDGGGGGGGKKKTKKQMKDAQQPKSIVFEDEVIVLDARLSAPQKTRLKSRPIHFVEPGTYVALGEKKRSIAMKAEESGYISGRKVGNVVKSIGMGGGTVMDNITSIVVDTAISEDYYGSSASVGVIEQRLPSRCDAPEIELEDFTTQKRVLTNVSDVNVEHNEDVILKAIQNAMSSMPYAVEWWDAELLPSKVRKELAEQEGKSIASRTMNRQHLGGTKTPTAIQATNTMKVLDDAMIEEDDSKNNIIPHHHHHHTSATVAHFQSQKMQQEEIVEKCYTMASISNSKTYTLVQHIVPILTPAQLAAKEALKNKPPTLHLTKAEQKRHRKLRRAERLREQQDLQAAGLIPPPEPRLTLSNYMKVLGDQAVIDPSKMEAVVMSQIHGRKLKHEQMNAERKLTKEQKAAKHAKKLQEDTTQSVHVALFYVKDMSHPYHRAKVDLNAQQNGITGGVLECSSLSNSDCRGIIGFNTKSSDATSSMALVVAEGGEKAIKRYVRLMTVRMRWRGEDFYEEDEDDEVDQHMDEYAEIHEQHDDDDSNGHVDRINGDGVTETNYTNEKKSRKKFNPNNECELIWSGMSLKRAFHTFMFQNAENSLTARKVLEAKGVAHYWDLAVGHVERKEQKHDLDCPGTLKASWYHSNFG